MSNGKALIKSKSKANKNGRQALRVRRHRAKKLGLIAPGLPPLAPPIYKGKCRTCGAEVVRKKADGRTDRCNGCRRKEHRSLEYAKRRIVRKAAGPATYKGLCTACGVEVIRRKSDGRIDRCDGCRSKEYWKLHGDKWKPNARARARQRHKLTYQAKKEAGELWPQKNLARRRQHANNWHKRNRAASSAAYYKYMTAKIKRIPPWSDLKAIKCFYEIARRVTQCTGIRFEVDHIVPLRGRTVSGLHVPTNLRVIPKSMNSKKHNSFAEAG
jgi:hypothetical protein